MATPATQADAPDGRADVNRPRHHEVLRWRKLTVVFLAGAVIAAFGVVANVALGWTDIWPEFFLTVGSTFSLGGVLFVLQRSWVSEVTTEVRQVEEEVQTAVRVVEKRASEIETELRARRPIRLDELRTLVDSHAAGVTEERRSAIDVLRADLSMENLSAVLGVAQNLRAISPGFRVRASFSAKAPRLLVWLVDEDDRGFSIEPHVELVVRPLDADQTSTDPILWVAGESVEPVIAALIAACQRANIPPVAPDFDPAEGFRQLVDSLDVALSIRQGAAGPRLKGGLVEVIDEAWTLTSYGLENRFRSIAIPLGDFVDYYYNSSYNDDWTPHKHLKNPPAPEHVAPAEWEYLVEVVRCGLPTNPPPGITPISI